MQINGYHYRKWTKMSGNKNVELNPMACQQECCSKMVENNNFVVIASL